MLIAQIAAKSLARAGRMDVVAGTRVAPIRAVNDEIERRGVAPPSNKAETDE